MHAKVEPGAAMADVSAIVAMAVHAVAKAGRAVENQVPPSHFPTRADLT